MFSKRHRSWSRSSRQSVLIAVPFVLPLSRRRAEHGQPHPGLGPVRHRLRHPVRLHRPAVVRPVGVLRHRRLRRRLPADPRRLHRNVVLALLHRHGRRRGRRLSGRPARAAPHRHLLRDDHRRHRRDVLLRRVQSRCRTGPAARTACPACRRRASTSASRRCNFTTGWALYPFLAFCFFVGIVIALRIVRSPVGAILTRDPRQPAARRGGRPQRAGLQADRLRDRRRLCRLRRRAARRAAGLHAARRLHLRHLRPAVMQTAIGGARHAVRPAGRRRRLAVPAGLPAGRAELGAAWKLVLGLVFVLLVCFLRQRHHRRHQGPVRAHARQAPAAAEPGPRKPRRAAAAAPVAPHGRAPCRAAASYRAGRCCRPRPDQALRRPRRQRGHRLRGRSRASCAASSARTAPARAPSSRCSPARCRRPSGTIVFEAATSPA